MRVHDKLWVVIGRNREENLAYMTYEGPKAATEKRKATGRKWADGYRKWCNKTRTYLEFDEPLKELSLDNKPTTGFVIGDSVSRWSTQNKLFRVKDPRGFMVEVPTGNISTLLNYTTVVNGIIQDECVWGRDGNNHILLPKGSEPYEEAMSNETEMRNQMITGSKMKIGDHLRDAHGNQYVYLGRYEMDYHTTGTVYKHSQTSDVYHIKGVGNTADYDCTPVKIVDVTSDKQKVYCFAYISQEGEIKYDRMENKLTPKMILLESEKFTIDPDVVYQAIMTRKYHLSGYGNAIPGKVGKMIEALSEHGFERSWNYGWRHNHSYHWNVRGDSSVNSWAPLTVVKTAVKV